MENKINEKVLKMSREIIESNLSSDFYLEKTPGFNKGKTYFTSIDLLVYHTVCIYSEKKRRSSVDETIKNNILETCNTSELKSIVDRLCNLLL